MRKRIFQIIVILILLILCTGSVFADYPHYFNGDPNCVLVAGHMGSGWYIKKNSAKLLGEENAVSAISIDVLYVPDAYDGKKNVSKVTTYEFAYDSSTATSVEAGMSPQKMMFFHKDGEITYVDPHASMAEVRITLPAGEMAYAIIYQKKFYGNGICNFGQDFYRGILY